MMTLSAGEFMRRFLLHILLCGFHRIHHYGLIANADRKKNLAKARELLHVVHNGNAVCHKIDAPTSIVQPTLVCPGCGSAMIITDTWVRRHNPFDPNNMTMHYKSSPSANSALWIGRQLLRTKDIKTRESR